MTVERRGAGRWPCGGPKDGKKEPTRVPARAGRWWSSPGAIGLVKTERLTGAPGDEAKRRSLSTEHPPTGEPDAGDPPVRFGGRGAAIRSSYPYQAAGAKGDGLREREASWTALARHRFFPKTWFLNLFQKTNRDVIYGNAPRWRPARRRSCGPSSTARPGT